MWTAGVKPAPAPRRHRPAADRRAAGCAAPPTLRSTGAEHAWAAGDAAAVPDLTADRARHGVRRPTPSTPCARPGCSPRTSSRRCAASPLSDYRHKYAGSVASLGLHKGVAHVYGRKLKGYPAWLMHRAYHLSRVPTFNRKARVLAEWTLAGLFKREIVSLGSLEHPRAEFETRGRRRARPDPRAPAGRQRRYLTVVSRGRSHWTCDHRWARTCTE